METKDQANMAQAFIDFGQRIADGEIRIMWVNSTAEIRDVHPGDPEWDESAYAQWKPSGIRTLEITYQVKESNANCSSDC